MGSGHRPFCATFTPNSTCAFAFFRASAYDGTAASETRHPATRSRKIMACGSLYRHRIAPRKPHDTSLEQGGATRVPRERAPKERFGGRFGPRSLSSVLRGLRPS